MSGNARSEARYLAQDERELVARTHHPQIRELPDDELARLQKLVREAADRARAIAHRQRREIRRKAQPAGARPAADDAGSARKVSILVGSVRRLGKEVHRRETKAARADLATSARRALAMRKRTEEGGPHHPDPGRKPGEGMQAVESARTEEIADPREAGRVSQFVRDAQARRDRR